MHDQPLGCLPPENGMRLITRRLCRIDDKCRMGNDPVKIDVSASQPTDLGESACLDGRYSGRCRQEVSLELPRDSPIKQIRSAFQAPSLPQENGPAEPFQPVGIRFPQPLGVQGPWNFIVEQHVIEQGRRAIFIPGLWTANPERREQADAFRQLGRIKRLGGSLDDFHVLQITDRFENPDSKIIQRDVPLIVPVKTLSKEVLQKSRQAFFNVAISRWLPVKGVVNRCGRAAVCRSEFQPVRETKRGPVDQLRQELIEMIPADVVGIGFHAEQKFIESSIDKQGIEGIPAVVDLNGCLAGPGQPGFYFCFRIVVAVA